MGRPSAVRGRSPTRQRGLTERERMPGRARARLEGDAGAHDPRGSGASNNLSMRTVARE